MMRSRMSAVTVLSVTLFASLWALGPSLVLAAGNEGCDDRQRYHLSREVPLYSQLANVGVEWTSCGPTALAMALNYGVSGPTPQAVVRYAMSHLGKDEKPLYLPRDPQRVFTPPVNLYEIALYYGHPQMGWVTDEEEAQARLRELLSRDLPVIVDVTVAMRRNESNAAHFVVVTGIGADNSVYVNDPYGRGTGGKRLSVTWEDFYWAWQHNSDGPVGGRGWWMVSVPTITAVTTRENPSCRPQLRGCVLTLQP